MISQAAEDAKSVPSSAAGGKKSKLGAAGANTDKLLFTEVYVCVHALKLFISMCYCDRCVVMLLMPARKVKRYQPH